MLGLLFSLALFFVAYLGFGDVGVGVWPVYFVSAHFLSDFNISIFILVR